MEKRVLLPQTRRKPKAYLSYMNIIDMIGVETGFQKNDIKRICECFLQSISEGLHHKKQVNLPSLGILYPAIKPSRVGMSLNGGKGTPTRVIVPDRWMARFQPSRDLARELEKITVTSKELESQYK